jgi:DNA-binding NtrC family response regulator
MTQPKPPGRDTAPPPDAHPRTKPILPSTVELPRIELRVEREGGAPSTRAVVLDGDHFLVGSHPKNDLVLSDPAVSRFHFRLSRSGRGWAITDTGSTNGTRVDGVRARDADLTLPTCKIEVGGSVLRARELEPTEEELPAAVRFGSLHGASVAMRRLFDLIGRAAPTDANVLLEGESGTGKELVAKELVRRSKRADKPLVIVDCGAISPNLIESELFGHVRGAFTGADRPRVGAFEEANTGTLFLDELGELPLDMQPKLLRALESREVRKVGENQLRKVDVRVIAATNRNLEREVNQGRFREDLYFRLSVVTLRLPALRERIDDLPLLVSAILASLHANQHAPLFTPELLAEMARSDWPGNVRELRNYVERRIVLGPGASPEPPALRGSPPQAAQAIKIDVDTPFKKAKEELVHAFEESYVKAVLEWAQGNISRAARKAQVDRMYLHRLLNNHGLHRGSSLAD